MRVVYSIFVLEIYIEMKWVHVGSVGWDGGALLVGSPENIYALAKDHKDKDEYEIFFQKDLVSQYNMLLLNDFGGDGMANISVLRSDNGIDKSIRIQFTISPDYDNPKQKNVNVSWKYGTLIVLDPIAITELIHKAPTLTDYFNWYAKEVKKKGLYHGLLTDLWLDNLDQSGSLNVVVYQDTQYDFIDSEIVLNASMNGGGDAGNTEITLEQVAQHGSRDDAWIAIDGNVYDVTEWIPQHPGGDTIMNGVGTDATDLFNSIGHPSYVKEQVFPLYLIGKLI